MRIDIDRLHAHFLGQAGGRRSGRSTAIAAMVLGTLEYMEDGEGCVVLFHTQAQGFAFYDILVDLAMSMGIEPERFERTTKKLYFKGLPGFVWFVVIGRNTWEKLRGMGDRVAIFKD